MESLQSLLVPALVLVFFTTPYIDAGDDHHHSIIALKQHHSHPSRRSDHLTGHHGKFRASKWNLAHATFYGGSDGSDTRAGACGYHDTVSQGYGLQTTALSNAVFNDGLSCGACFEIKCHNDPKWCKPGNPSILVTATIQCPPNYYLPSDNEGWCKWCFQNFFFFKFSAETGN